MQAADRSLRSVFVGNIPYDATEEKLRDIFSAVGPVLSFRIVFDRETGKPKGYGFCEYKDQETATSAIRNLNGHDLGGRQLRVDSASNERARDEPPESQLQQQQQQQIVSDNSQLQHQQQPHQAPPVAEPLVDAQTIINNVLCSLPPEQLFDVCKQLKSSLLVNPNETRQLFVQNPQLTFAILQSLVMIKAIDAQTAMNTLHKQLMQPTPMQPSLPMMAMMQPQVLNPYAFVTPQTATIAPPPPSIAPSQVSAPPAVPITAADPRLNPADPRMAQALDPRMAQADPRLQIATSGPTSDPRLMAADPRLARQQQQQQSQQPGPQPPAPWPFAAM